MENYQKEIKEFLVDLLNIPSPTGYTDQGIEFVQKAFEEAGCETKLTKKRALSATIPGEEKEAITFSAHIDTLGLMVKDIKPNGRLEFSLVGGYAPVTIEGNYVTIHAKDKEYRGTVLYNEQSVHTYQGVNTAERKPENMEVRIDELVHSKEDTEKLGIRVGDFISLDPNVETFENGLVKSRHLDDKCSIAALLAVAKSLKDENIKTKKSIHFFISNYEEVGHGSAAAVDENSEAYIAVDMAAMGATQTSREDYVTICAKDSSGPYDYLLKEELVELAEENNLDYVLDIYKYYGSDASAMQRAGYDIPAIIIGPGVESSHAYERTHMKGVLETAKLCQAFIKNRNK